MNREMVPGWRAVPIDDEYLIARSFQHPWMLVPPALPAAVITAVAVMLSFGREPTAFSIVLLVLEVPFVVRFAWKVAQWWADRIYVTTKKIRRESGLLEQKTQEIPLVHVVTLIYRRSILGRILGYGECMLNSAGHDPMRILYMPHECYIILAQLLARTPARDQQTRQAS